MNAQAASDSFKTPYIKVLKRTNDYVVLRLSAELGAKHFNQEELESLLEQCIDLKKSIIIDLGDFVYLNKNMVSFLIGLQSSLHEQGLSLILTKLKNRLKTLFVFLKLNDFLVHTSSIKEAEKALKD